MSERKVAKAVLIYECGCVDVVAPVSGLGTSSPCPECEGRYKRAEEAVAADGDVDFCGPVEWRDTDFDACANCGGKTYIPHLDKNGKCLECAP